MMGIIERRFSSIPTHKSSQLLAVIDIIEVIITRTFKIFIGSCMGGIIRDTGVPMFTSSM